MSEKWEIKIVQPQMCIMPVGLISENFQLLVGSSYVSLDFLRITAFLSRYRTTDSCLSIASHPKNVSATGSIRRLIFVGLSLEYFSEKLYSPHFPKFGLEAFHKFHLESKLTHYHLVVFSVPKEKRRFFGDWSRIYNFSKE